MQESKEASRSKKIKDAEVVGAAKLQGAMDKYTTKDHTLKAEIRWCLKVVDSNFSLNSCNKLSELFSVMFSQSANMFRMGNDKCAYVLSYGLAPYMHKDLL